MRRLQGICKGLTVPTGVEAAEVSYMVVLRAEGRNEDGEFGRGCGSGRRVGGQDGQAGASSAEATRAASVSRRGLQCPQAS